MPHAPRRKTVVLMVTVDVSPWARPDDVRREVLSRVNDGCGHGTSGPDGEEISIKIRKTKSVGMVEFELLEAARGHENPDEIPAVSEVL